MTYFEGELVIAARYDADYAVQRGTADIAFYVEEARRSGGPVAEFACGTGRVLIPTAAAGVEIMGVDVSPAMLAQAQANLTTAGHAVELVQGDMRSVSLGRTFPLVTLPFRPFQHMLTIEDQLAVLANLRRHVAPGGRLVLDLFQPDLTRITQRDESEQLEYEHTDEEGRTTRRYASVRSEPWKQLLHIRFRWELVDSSGAVEEQHATFGMRWFLQAEMEHLLARSGFAVEQVYGSFDREPLGPASQELIFSATPASPASR